MKSIVKKVTDSEYVLKRRQLDISDFQVYLRYTINLDKLLAARIKRSLETTTKVSKELHDMLHAIQKTLDNHIIYIFDRSVRRFAEEVSLWNDYIVFLQGKDATAALNAVFGKALALYPKNEEFWLQAAVHELEANSNVHSARITLQRSLRANPSSKKLWLRYFELELWNALRATERQKALEIQEDYEVLQGAPMVVFNHALLALPDIQSVLEVYSACETVGGDFAEKMREILIAKYGHKQEVWQHFAETAVTHMNSAATTTPEQSDRAEEQEEGQSKRKFSETHTEKESRASTVVLAIAESLEKTVSVLSQGSTHEITEAAITTGAGILTTSTASTTSNSPYTSMAVQVLLQAITQAREVLGEVEASSLQQLFHQVDSERVGTTPGKKRKAKKTDETATTSGSSTAVTRLIAALTDVLTLRKTLCDKETDRVTSQLLPSTLTSLSNALRFQVGALCQSLLQGAADLTSELTCQTLTAVQLADWIESTVSVLTKCVKRDFRYHQQTTSAKNTEISASVDAWCVPLLSLLTDGLDMLDDVDRVHTLLSTLLSSVTALVVTSMGSDAVKRILVSVHHTADETLAATALTALQSIIADTHTLISSEQRCTWCVFYFSHILYNPTDRFIALSDGYKYIQSVISSKPHLFHSTDLSNVYEYVLEEAVELPESADVLLFRQNVAEKALVMCPSVAQFWTELEETQQKRGELKAATHTRWRRDKALSNTN